MSKLSNTLLMLQLLQNGRKYSIKELAEKIKSQSWFIVQN